MLNIEDVQLAVSGWDGFWGGTSMERDFGNPKHIAEDLLTNSEGIYDSQSKTIWFADINGEGDIYGIQYAQVNVEDAVEWFCEADIPVKKAYLMNFCIETMPAPGTGAKNRLQFLPMESVEEFLGFCDELSKVPTVGNDTFERLLTMMASETDA